MAIIDATWYAGTSRPEDYLKLMVTGRGVGACRPCANSVSDGLKATDDLCAACRVKPLALDNGGGLLQGSSLVGSNRRQK